MIVQTTITRVALFIGVCVSVEQEWIDGCVMFVFPRSHIIRFFCQLSTFAYVYRYSERNF